MTLFDLTQRSFKYTTSGLKVILQPTSTPDTRH